jgi:hypothetical protein
LAKTNSFLVPDAYATRETIPDGRDFIFRVTSAKFSIICFLFFPEEPLLTHASFGIEQTFVGIISSSGGNRSTWCQYWYSTSCIIPTSWPGETGAPSLDLCIELLVFCSCGMTPILLAGSFLASFLGSFMNAQRLYLPHPSYFLSWNAMDAEMGQFSSS